MIAGLDASMIQIWFTVAVVTVAVVMFAIDRIPLEIPTIGAVCALMLFSTSSRSRMLTATTCWGQKPIAHLSQRDS